MYVLITCIRLHDAAKAPAVLQVLENACASLPAIRSSLVQPAVNVRPGDPQVLMRLCFDREEDYRATQLDPVWTGSVLPLLDLRSGAEVETIFYRRTVYGAPHPDISGGIWRALIIAAREGTASTTRRQFESEIQLMPAYIGTIRNWAMNPVLSSTGSRRWSYVWEQDYDDVEGLLGEYMKHPIHMGLIDRWFDPEHPDHIFDARRLRMVCQSPHSAIAPPVA